MTGHGGWPLNAFLTPDGVPFYAGTYFPPEPRHGHAVAGAGRSIGVARRVAGAARRRSRRPAQRILPRLQGAGEPRARPRASSTPAALDAAVADAAPRLRRRVRRLGAAAPKFPAASTIEFLLRRGEREMALHTLRAMASGGMYDQIGGGFSRYSVDARWIVPHFEKMLYDNALLARAYLHGCQVSGEPFFARVAHGDARLGAARPAPARGRLRLRARRRLRGRRGQVLRLDARRGARRARARTRRAALAHFGLDGPRNFEGAEHPRARHARSASGWTSSRRGLRAARERARVARRSTTSA